MDEKDMELDKLDDTLQDNIPEEKLDENGLENRDGVNYETSDNWQFEAEAPTLSNDLFDGEVDLPAQKPSSGPIEYQSPAVQAKVKDSRKKELLHFIPTALLILAIAVMLVVLGVRYYTVPNGKEGKMMNPASVVATVDGTKVSIGMFNYYYSSMVSYHESYASYGYFDLDTTKDYASQYTTDADGNKITWKDYFEQETLKEIEQLTAYYTAAVKAGVQLTDAQKETIDSQIESLKTSASSQNVSLDEYISKNFGEYCSEDTLRLMLEQYYITANYKGKLATETQISQDEIDAHFAENKSKYNTINFSYLMLEYDSTDDQTKEKSQKAVDDYLNKITDRDSIIDLVPEVYKDLIDQEAANAMASDEDMTQEEAEKTAIASYEQRIDATVTGSDTPFSDEINEWLFSDDTPVGSKNSYIDESTGNAYLILKTEKAKLLDDETYSVRHILIQPEEEGTETDESGNAKYSEEQMESAKSKAEEILKEFNSGDKTEYSFALLAEQNSTDTGSTSAGSNGAFGGLYEGVSLGQMVPSFEEWSVDSQRKYGDTDIVESDFGYHIMFFVNNCPAYEAQIILELKNDKINDIAEKADIKHHDKIIEKAINNFYSSRSAAASAENQTAQ
ncbi:MAG: peptidyl-prolyl cis-trans isomerase [Eubacterium sp.]|nr:peptidyl-prolyl cis-trans isomerase [Eubacterium sp.]